MAILEEVQRVNDSLNKAHGESKQALGKTIENHCPFGCRMTDLDEFGYCHHLIGFTDDRHTIELVKPLYRHYQDGTPYNTNFRVTGVSKGECLLTDTFVNPERKQFVDKRWQVAKAWVSDRVYRNIDKPAEVEAPAPGEPNELYALQVRKRELMKKLEAKKLVEEVAALEAELGESKIEVLELPKAKKPGQVSPPGSPAEDVDI